MPECLRHQLLRVLWDGEWHTGLDICHAVGRQYGTGVTAKIRQLRNPKYGGFTIESRVNVALSRACNRQVWEYRLAGQKETGPSEND